MKFQIESIFAWFSRFNSIKNVVWDIVVNDQGKCLLSQNPHQSEPLLASNIVIELSFETDGSKSFKAPFKSTSASVEVTGLEEISFTRE